VLCQLGARDEGDHRLAQCSLVPAEDSAGGSPRPGTAGRLKLLTSGGL
jgi:hypothetical protein